MVTGVAALLPIVGGAVVRNVGGEVVKAGGEIFSSVKQMNPYDLIPTHGITQSKRQFQNLIDNIAENGIQNPISYIERNGNNYILDGHHRVQAAKNLDIDQVPVQKVDLPFKGYTSEADLNNWDR